MPCARHPWAVALGGLCPACLLEGAIEDGQDPDPEREASAPTTGVDDWHLSIHVPLGSSAHAVAYLVHDERQPARLLRLKCWRDPAPDGFMARYLPISERLAALSIGGVARPLAATLDGAGRLAVLSEFVQGTSLADGLAAGSLDQRMALELIRPLSRVLRAAHARGLAHGSLVPGNVILHPQSGAASLLDFGVGAAWSPLDQDALVSADRRWWAGLLGRLRHTPSASHE